MTRQRIDLRLVELGLFESRAKARAAIEAGGVTANGMPVRKPSDLVETDAAIVAVPAHDYVGRGALKLAFGLEHWQIDLTGRVVLDIGASTGGFTEVCLRGGAITVYAVDVGQGQLHPRIAADARVVSLEKTDARTLDRTLIPREVDVVVCDVSFVSLTKVLSPALGLAQAGADLIALVKPQFEAGRAAVGKGGIVTDDGARADAVRAVSDYLEAHGWAVLDTVTSPVTGGDGNVEVLLHARKRRPG